MSGSPESNLMEAIFGPKEESDPTPVLQGDEAECVKVPYTFSLDTIEEVAEHLKAADLLDLDFTVQTAYTGPMGKKQYLVVLPEVHVG